MYKIVAVSIIIIPLRGERRSNSKLLQKFMATMFLIEIWMTHDDISCVYPNEDCY